MSERVVDEGDGKGKFGGVTVWLNGEIVSADEARVGIFDAGLQHGVGLFETMSATGGKVQRLREHLQRLERSACELKLTEELHVGPLCEAVEMTVRESGIDEARVRLTLTGGDLNLLRGGDGKGIEPTIFIVVQRATVYPEEFFEKGVRVMIADGRLNPFDSGAGHKTVNYWSRLRALQDAAGKKCGEAIWLSVSNHVMSGSVSNLFVVRNGEILTPIAHGEEGKGAVPMAVLPGITRGCVCEFAEARGMVVVKRMLDISDVLDAEEVFLTNSSWGVLPVIAVEGKAIGDGVVGEVAKVMRGAWLAERAGLRG